MDSNNNAMNNNPGLQDDDRSGSSLADKARDYLERREQRQLYKEAIEEASITQSLQEKPTINANSNRIAQERGRHQDIGQALYEQAQTQRANRALEKEEVQSNLNMSPAITKLAAELVRDGDIADRLYMNAKKKGAQGQLETSPVTSRPSRHSLEYTNRLYRRGLASQKAKAQAIAECDLEAKKTASTSNISATSRRLAKKYEESAKDRAQKQEKKINELIEEPSFKPTINAKSEEIGTARHAGQNPYLRLHSEYQARAARQSTRQSGRIAREQEELKECTFKPHINQFNSNTTIDENVVQRLLDWHSRSERRKEELVKKKESQITLPEECTFKPQINDHIIESKKLSSIRDDRSVNEFLARQQKARAERDRINAFGATPANWSNRITVPVGPSLTTAKRSTTVKKGKTEEKKSKKKTKKKTKTSTKRNGGASEAENPAAIIVKSNAQPKPTRAPPPEPPAAPAESSLDEFKLLKTLLNEEST